MKDIHITIATGIFPPSIGGPASYSKMLLDFLGPYGYDVTIVTFDSVRKYPKIIRHIMYFFLLCKHSISSDILYAQDPVSVGLPALCVAKLFRKPLMVRLGGDYAWEQAVGRFGCTDTLDDFVTKKQPYIYVRMLQSIQRYVVSHSQATVVPSAYLKRIVTQWGIDEQILHVIYNAFTPPDVRKKNIHRKTFTIVTVGRLVPWKGFATLIDTVVTLHTSYPHVTLTIIGDGIDKEMLEKKIQQAHAESYIQMKGALSKDAVYTELSCADAFVLFTSYEGFSHLILEAMSIGVPILTTAVGGNTEILRDMDNALLIPHSTEHLEKGLRRMIDDSELRERIATEAQKNVAVYTEDKMFAELDMLIRKHI